MAQPPEILPEGTDSIVPGASVDGEPGDGFALGHGLHEDGPANAGAPGGSSGPLQEKVAGAAAEVKDTAAGIKDDAVATIGDKTAGLRDQAADKARTFAQQGKDKATEALDNVVKLVDDAAGTIDEKVGEQYGDYVRRAGDALAGFATQLRGKEVEDLVVDARQAVRGSPALAIGAAAAVGFLIARIVKVGATSQPAGGSAEGSSETTSA